MNTLRFVVPMPPNLANSRMHWRAKHNKRKAYFDLLDTWRAAKLIPAPPSALPSKAQIGARMHLGAQMDHDNAVARLKWPVDWLVRSGYLVGDKPSQLEWAGFPEQAIRRGVEYTIEFTITPL